MSSKVRPLVLFVLRVFRSKIGPLHPHHALSRRPEFPVEPSLTQLTAILHTIFFHRYFTSISPLTRDLLDLTLPAIDDVDLETLIEQRTMALVRAIDSTHQQRGRGQLVVQFFEKKRKKAYFFGRAEEDVCWEQWTLDVTLAQPRTETGTLPVHDVVGCHVLTGQHRCAESATCHDQVAREGGA
jgi:hypothetical protein